MYDPQFIWRGLEVVTGDGRCERCGQYLTLTRDSLGRHVCLKEPEKGRPSSMPLPEKLEGSSDPVYISHVVDRIIDYLEEKERGSH